MHTSWSLQVFLGAPPFPPSPSGIPTIVILNCRLQQGSQSSFIYFLEGQKNLTDSFSSVRGYSNANGELYVLGWLVNSIGI